MCSNDASPIQLNEARSANNMELGRQKDQDLPFFSFSAIKTATDYFAESNKLGEGGYGPVYKAILQFPALNRLQSVIVLLACQVSIIYLQHVYGNCRVSCFKKDKKLQ